MKNGTRVKFNDKVAWAFVGKTGKIINSKPSCFAAGELFVVELDTPVRPADGWSEVETLACEEACLDLI